MAQSNWTSGWNAKSLWLSLNQIAALFERDKSVVSRHLRNVYATADEYRAATVGIFCNSSR